jgi:hypothetical protein
MGHVHMHPDQGHLINMHVCLSKKWMLEVDVCWNWIHLVNDNERVCPTFNTLESNGFPKLKDYSDKWKVLKMAWKAGT